MLGPIPIKITGRFKVPQSKSHENSQSLQSKTVVVDGQKMVMSSVDGRTWFLRMESLYEYERRLREAHIPSEQSLQLIPD
jgi:hypothetical protein